MAAPNGGCDVAPVVQEHLYKILVIGEFGVGKTSIIRRYTEGYFSPNYKLTIGVDFALKTLYWNKDTKINLQLWDIAGHERFGHMTRVYYKYAIAAIVVFDLTRPATFDSVLKWLNDVNSKVMLANEEPVPVIMLANKCDLPDVNLEFEKLTRFCLEQKIIAWFPTSAKEDINIEKSMNYIVQHILNLSLKNKSSPEHIELKHPEIIYDGDENEEDNKHKNYYCCFL